MKTRNTGAILWMMASALSLALFSCGGDSPGFAGVAGSGGTAGEAIAQVLPGLGFVASSFGFYYPDDPAAGLDGFDLDGRVSRSDSPGADECAHDDRMGPNQEPGIDYGFLEIIDNEAVREDGKAVFGGFHEGQLVDGVISGAVKNGSMTILLQIDGLDDPQNDDDVRVQIYSSEDSPALGTDSSVLLGATLSIHPDSRFHSGEVQGSVVDGVLTAGPIDFLFPIDIMIVRDELLIHDSWMRVELLDDGFQGTVSGYWDVANIRDIIGVPTTDNGNAANFTIEQFDAAMAELADGDYDAGTGLCSSFSTMFRIGGVQAFIVSDSSPGGMGGNGGSGGGRVIPTPLDQCVNDADQAALDALATDELSGPAIVGMIAGDCPLSACTSELGGVLSDGSEAARNALGDCIANCISDQTGLSTACTGCYGSIASCSTAFCLAPCLPPNSGSQECANCALENCIDVNACTGLY
ncbi:MAG: hypothetical protein WBB42_17790 [Polyangiales bacterium]